MLCSRDHVRTLGLHAGEISESFFDIETLGIVEMLTSAAEKVENNSEDNSS